MNYKLNYKLLTKNYKAIMLILLIILTLYTLFNISFTNNEIDFNEVYAEVEKISYEEPKKVNNQIENVLFYLPNGYDTIDKDGIFFQSTYSQLEIIPKKIDNNLLGKNYDINTDEKVVFKKINENSDTDINNFVNMIVWKINQDTYEVLLMNEANNTIVADIKDQQLVEGIIDMAYILNSVKIEEE